MRETLCSILAIVFLTASDVSQRATPPESPSVVEKLRLAFPDGAASNATFKVEIRTKGLVIAYDHFSIERDGRLKLFPCFIARFQEANSASSGSRPTSIRSPVAFVTLDEPLRALSDLGNRKIISVDLEGGLRLTGGE